MACDVSPVAMFGIWRIFGIFGILIVGVAVVVGINGGSRDKRCVGMVGKKLDRGVGVGGGGIPFSRS